MNAGIVTSFIVGGVMLLSILSFNGQVLTNTKETTISTINQSTLDEITELIINDFNRIGYQSASANPFSKIESDDLIFEADVYDTDSYGVTNIRWESDKWDAVTSTSNPNDFYLKRTGPTGVSSFGTLRFPVTHFNIVYRTANDTETNNSAIVKKIEVELIIESAEPYDYTADGTGKFHRTVWKRTFVPNNINLPY